MPFILTVNAKGEPGVLLGPHGIKTCKKLMRDMLRLGVDENEPITITDGVKSQILKDHAYRFEYGGGIFIVDTETPTIQSEASCYRQLNENRAVEMDLIDGTIRYMDTTRICLKELKVCDWRYQQVKQLYFEGMEVCNSEDD